MKKPGIAINKTDTTIKIEWKNLLLGLGDVLVFGFSALAAGGAGTPEAISAAVSSAASFNLDEPIESRAHALVALSFATALDRLSSTPNTVLDKDAAREISIAIGEAIETETHVVTPSFFYNPTSLSLYQVTRSLLIDALGKVRPSQESKEELGAKIDASFVSSVYQVLSLRREYFQPLLHSLENPALAAAAREFDWDRYRAKLVARFTVDPVFGQETSKVSLSQLYVPCRCTWLEEREGGHVKRTGDLPEVVQSWLTENNEDDAIRLISGGPGSGKSSFAKSVAAELAGKEQFRPIFLELQKLGSFVDLQRAVVRRLVDEEESFAADPLENKEDHRRFVLIFDGLDELVLPGGDAANRVAESFASALGTLLRTLNVPGKCRAKAIVTGRTAIAQVFQSAVLSASPQACLEVMGFVGGNAHNAYDLRPIWWERYALAFSLPTVTPQAYSAAQLRSVTSEPLLCYLLALSGYALSGWEDVANNHNKIYDKLLGEVWERRWGRAGKSSVGRVGPALSLNDRSDFDALMESMALAAWWAGENRVATKDSFEKALVLANANSAWEKFRQDDGDAMGNLALTFYFRKAESDSQGIEFTHKSFSEYLVCRFLVRNLVNKICSSLSSGALEYREALDRWARTATSAIVSEDMKTFMYNECKSMSVESLGVARGQLEILLRRLDSTGLPVQQFNESILKAWERNCIGQANMLHSYQEVRRALALGGQTLEHSDICSSDAKTHGDFVRRLADLYVDERSANLDFSNLRLESQFLNGVFLLNAKFDNSLMTKANFHCASLSHASFASAVLPAATFSQADLNSADFRGADLRGVDFSGAYIYEAYLPANWVDVIDPRTFDHPPNGAPFFVEDGEVLGPESDNYPDLKAIFEEKRRYYKESNAEFEHETFFGPYTT